MQRHPQRGSPTGALLVGVSFFAMAYYWSNMTGARPDAADQLFLDFFMFMGGLSVLSGLTGYYRAWRQREQRKAAEVPSGTFGEAAFASLEDCAAAGLLDPRGLYLGLLDGQPLFYSGKAHLLTCAPARQGKGICVATANLMHYPGAVMATDPKGELAAASGGHRAEFYGHKVVYFNPWGLHGLAQHRINPLAGAIALAADPQRQRGLTGEVKASPSALSRARGHAESLLARRARAILRAVLLYLALCEPKRCTLPEMWRIIATPRRLERTIEAMRRSDALGGLLADLADDLAYQLEDNPEHFGDFRAGAVQALDISEPGGHVAEAVSGSDISLDELNSGKVTIFLIVPQDKIVTYGAVLALIIGEGITAVTRSEGDGEVLFMLDEFANMGKLSGLAESLTALPGLGVRVWMFVQELAEIVRLYGPHTARTVLSQAEVKQFFAVQDDQLARTLSQVLGQRTVKTRNYNLGRFDDDDVGESLSETGRPLMAADEIRMMGPNEQLLLIKALPPIRAHRLPFWFVEPWASWAAPNPVEGPYPKVRPRLRLTYRKKVKTNG